MSLTVAKSSITGSEIFQVRQRTWDVSHVYTLIAETFSPKSGDASSTMKINPILQV